VVHADLGALVGGREGCELEVGTVIHPAVAVRLACDARIQVVAHDGTGRPVGIGRTARNVPPWLLRALRHRDRTCTFPGCGFTRFVHAHHIQPWERGGPTDLDNLVLVCPFHHKLVHEHGWAIALGEIPGTADWFRPDGTRYCPGRAPPRLADTA
jgi:hypothetical protein